MPGPVGALAPTLKLTAREKAPEKTESGFAITESHLELKAKIPGADPAAFDKAAGNAKAGCPVSKLFNTKVTMNAALEG